MILKHTEYSVIDIYASPKKKTYRRRNYENDHLRIGELVCDVERKEIRVSKNQTAVMF